MAFIPYHQQNFGELSTQSLIELHLSASEAEYTKDYAVISTLAVTNSEVQSALSYDRSKNILPIMGMVAIIEQLGTAYARTDIPLYTNADHNGLKKALYYFNNNSFDDTFTQALYGLRNGIVHNASFYSVGIRSQGSYIFTYDHSQTEVIKDAETPWNGDFNNIELAHFTAINPALLNRVVQNCINTVSKLNKEDKISIMLNGGKNELIFRYFKWKEITH